MSQPVSEVTPKAKAERFADFVFKIAERAVIVALVFYAGRHLEQPFSTFMEFVGYALLLIAMYPVIDAIEDITFGTAPHSKRPLWRVILAALAMCLTLGLTYYIIEIIVPFSG